MFINCFYKAGIFLIAVLESQFSYSLNAKVVEFLVRGRLAPTHLHILSEIKRGNGLAMYAMMNNSTGTTKATGLPGYTISFQENSV